MGVAYPSFSLSKVGKYGYIYNVSSHDKTRVCYEKLEGSQVMPHSTPSVM